MTGKKPDELVRPPHQVTILGLITCSIIRLITPQQFTKLAASNDFLPTAIA